MAESLPCSAETITTSAAGYIPIQNDFGVKKNKNTQINNKNKINKQQQQQNHFDSINLEEKER